MKKNKKNFGELKWTRIEAINGKTIVHICLIGSYSPFGDTLVLFPRAMICFGRAVMSSVSSGK